MDRRVGCAGGLRAPRNWLEKAGRGSLPPAPQADFRWVTAGAHGHVSIDRAEGAAPVLVTRAGREVFDSPQATHRLELGQAVAWTPRRPPTGPGYSPEPHPGRGRAWSSATAPWNGRHCL